MGRSREEVRREGRLGPRAWLAGLACGLLLAAPSAAGLFGRVVTVHDGDTITILAAGRGVRIRLVGIDAPERGQPFSNASRHALEALAAGREVRVVEHGRDGYGRVLGRVYAGAVDVNAEQVRAGYAWVFRRFGTDAVLLALEAEAKAARRGLWRDPKAVPPWVWRDRRVLRHVALPRERGSSLPHPYSVVPAGPFVSSPRSLPPLASGGGRGRSVFAGFNALQRRIPPRKPFLVVPAPPAPACSGRGAETQCLAEFDGPSADVHSIGNTSP